MCKISLFDRISNNKIPYRVTHTIQIMDYDLTFKIITAKWKEEESGKKRELKRHLFVSLWQQQKIWKGWEWEWERKTFKSPWS